jgi:secreted PhoX family phosphatase
MSRSKQQVESSVAAAPAQPARRDFFRRGGLAAGGVVTAATLSALGAHTAYAHGDRHDDRDRRRARRSTYGELSPKADQNGDLILALPKHFHYATFSKTGDSFGGGLVVPRNHDGMACFDGRGDIVRLIRNHELRNAAGDFTLGVNGPAGLRYDAKGMGGCMTLDFDTKRKRLVRQFVSIGGTIVNCSGGWSLHNSGWLTCEESVSGAAQGFEKPHGYTFLVPASADSTVPAVPLTAMGRFAKEAAVADDRGIVYQTEDAGNSSGFYRFTPNSRHNLAAGGLLEMLAVTGNPIANMFTGQRVGVRLPVQWVPIPVADPALGTPGALSCFAQGRAAGAAAFNRLEGIFRSQDGESMYFLSTSGGAAARGQLWHYIPDEDGDTLVLVFESPIGSVLDSPDNLCITPNGAMLFCEDDASNDNDTHPLAPGITNINRLIGLGLAGEPFEFAVNILNDSEFAGACFSPDGEVLFVNLFGDATPGSGMTCAIWGPWENGPL